MGESILNFRYLSFHSFLKIQVSTWCIYFSSPFGTPFGVSSQQICTMTTCLRVLLSENAFYLHCWSIVLLGIEFWADKLVFFFFPLSLLKMLFTLLFNSIIYDEKAVAIQFGVSLCVKCCFPLVTFSIVPLSLVFNSLTTDVPRPIFIIFIR